MKKILGSLLVLFGLIVLYNANLHTQRSITKMQNNLNLEFVNECVKADLDNKTIIPSSYELTEALNVCAKGLLSLGITGDIFVIRVADKKLFWDNSTDCRPGDESKLYMTENGVCSLFRDQSTCLRSVDIMLSNEMSGYTTWSFDDSLEYINYRYLYKPIDNESYIIGQGTQSDELEKHFYPTYIAVVVWSIFIMLLLNY